MDETAYDALVAEFDVLWSRAPMAGDLERMDQILRLIEAFDATRRMASSA
jgi:hypothetical protein